MPLRKPRIPVPFFHASLFLIGGIYALLAFYAFSGGFPALSVIVISAGLGVALTALSLIDLHTMRLPDAITLPLTLCGLILAYLFEWGSLVWHLGGAAAGFIFLFGIEFGYRTIRSRPGIGLGDAKLFAAAGAWLGLIALSSVLLWACATALIAVICAVALNYPLNGSSRIPFGPFLSLGFWIVWLYGPITL